MPPAIQADNTNRFKLALTMTAYGKSKSEAYENLVASNWEQAIAAGRLIAKWRGAVLGRGGILSSGVVSEMGAARKSKVAFNQPILGTTGVHFGDPNISEADASLNTLATSLRVRFDTIEGDHATRQFFGVPDGFVNSGEYVALGQLAGKFLIGNPKEDMTATSLPAEPKQALWDFSSSAANTAPARRDGWVSYEEAWRQLLKAIFKNTYYSLRVVDTDGNVTGRETRAWEKLSFRGISGKALKNGSSR